MSDNGPGVTVSKSDPDEIPEQPVQPAPYESEATGLVWGDE